MPSTQRARSSVPLDQRSVVPSVPGVPAWGAVLVAVVAAVLGAVMDSIRGNELTATFASLYVIGCVAAVLAVRHRGLFTAIAQPPLIIFFGVPIAYQFLSDDAGASLKDIVLNVAIPLVNRFPLMIATTVLVLILGGARLLMDKRPKRTPRAKPARERAARSAATDRRASDARRAETRRPESGRPAPGRPDSGRSDSGHSDSGRSDSGREHEPQSGWPPSDPTRWSRGDNDGLSSDRPTREPRRRDRGEYEVPPRYDSPVYDAPVYDFPAYDAPGRDTRGRGQSRRESPNYDTPNYDTPNYDTPNYDGPSYNPPRQQPQPRRQQPSRTTGVRRPDAPGPDPYPAPRVRYRDRD